MADGDFEANIVVYWYIYKFAKRKRSVLQGLDTLTVANNGGEIQASYCKTGHKYYTWTDLHPVRKEIYM